MKKLAYILLSLAFIFVLTSCRNKNNPTSNPTETTNTTETIDPLKDEKQIITLVNSYSIKETKGFDYSLEQEYNGTKVNVHTLTLRLDNSSGLIGSKEEYKKELNEDISKGQYTELSATSYYKDEKVATKENDKWQWKDCKFDDFVSINLKSFNLDVSKLTDLKLTNEGQNKLLTIKINDNETSSFLGIKENVKNLIIKIIVNSNLNQLISFNMNYSQELTNTTFSLIPYYGNVSITLPN